MLLSVLLISSAILGAATLAGTLVLFQLRQTGEAQSSAQAVFAADAGTECALYQKYAVAGGDPASCSAELASGAQYMVEVSPDGWWIKSTGRSGRSARTFQLYLKGMCEFGGQFSLQPLCN